MKISGRSATGAVRAQLWPLPILGVTLAAVLWVLMPHLDALVDARLRLVGLGGVRW